MTEPTNPNLPPSLPPAIEISLQRLNLTAEEEGKVSAALPILIEKLGEPAVAKMLAEGTKEPEAEQDLSAASKDLADLLLSLFSPSQIKRLVSYNAPEILDRIPEGSPRLIADTTAQLLIERNLLTDALLEFMYQERPRRIQDIKFFFTRHPEVRQRSSTHEAATNSLKP